MKRPAPTTTIGPIAVVALAGDGSPVHEVEFTTPEILLSWLSHWRVESMDETLVVPQAWHHRRNISAAAEHSREDGTLPVSVYVGKAHLHPDTVLELVRAWRAANAPSKSRTGRFRNGPVEDTGRRGAYRYFRRRVRTFAERRESCLAEDGVPPVRARRNRLNLPDEREDIHRCLTRCWKKTRRTRWKAVRGEGRT